MGLSGWETLAASISEDADTIEDVYEPYLLQLGFLERTQRGRVATRGAYEHLGMEYASGAGRVAAGEVFLRMAKLPVSYRLSVPCCCLLWRFPVVRSLSLQMFPARVM